MRTKSRNRAALLAVGLTMWIVVGMASLASAFPAGGESFGAGTGGASCAAAQQLPPQVRRVEGLSAACAPVAAPAPDVVVQPPADFSPVGSPSLPVIAWLAIAAMGTAIVITTVRVRRHPRPAV